jgi:hypothetical protein
MVERQIGQTPVELQGPPFPELMEYVWSAFISLHPARGQGFNGPLPLSYTEIAAWQQLTGNQLSTWEVGVIKKLDSIYMRTING